MKRFEGDELIIPIIIVLISVIIFMTVGMTLPTTESDPINNYGWMRKDCHQLASASTRIWP